MQRTILVAIVSALVGVVVATPIAVYASHSFNDVSTTNTFHADIEWLKQSGVTRGCNPPDNTEFCPDDQVTREQMAAFMRRFAQYMGAEDGTPAQADNSASADNAATADFATTADHATTADSATTAEDTSALNGKDAELYERPIVMKTGNRFDGTHMADQDGEIARLSISAPADGTVVVEHSTSWFANGFGIDYTVFVWIEPFNESAVCDTQGDGDPIAGTFTSTSHFENVPGASASGAGYVSVDSGTTSYSLCLASNEDVSSNENWSFQAAWYPSDAADTSR